MASNRQAVLPFNEGSSTTRNSKVRGGKGAGLAEMAALGLPVPPGFTIATSVSRAFNEHGVTPKRLEGQLLRGIKALEKQTGREFGNPENPLLVSVRSGAEVSMPGMMDTILNVGASAEVLPGLIARFGEEFALDTLSRFNDQFTELVLGDSVEVEHIPTDPYEQLHMAIVAVLKSWRSESAEAYRTQMGLPKWSGTAVNVQAMVFGNSGQNSGTGVVFSRNPSTGQPGLYGEYLVNAQGEELVSGSRTPQPVASLELSQPAVYAQLVSHVETLAELIGGIADVEFTVEQGELFILQVRKATRSPLAAATFAVHQVWNKQWSREQALVSLTQAEIDELKVDSFDPQAEAQAKAEGRLLAEGLPASPGCVTGVVAHTSNGAQAIAASGTKAILVRPDTNPDDLPGLLAASAVVTSVGGATCHAAVVARGIGLPAVVGAQFDLSSLEPGEVVSVNGTSGLVYRGELPTTSVDLTKEANIFLRWHSLFATPEPHLAFERMSESHTANQLLNDFYLSDAMARAAKGSSLEAEAFKLQRDVQANVAELLATYLAIAITGEVRYYDNPYKTPKADAAMQKLRTSFNFTMSNQRDEMWNRSTGLKGHSLLEQAQYASLIGDVFEFGKWWGSMGGKLWADIARTLARYLSKELPLVAFVDHVWDLRHNGGVLFNKHRIVHETSRGYGGRGIDQQLEIKKNVTGVTSLHNGLKDYGFDPRVQALFDKGVKQGLW